MHSLLPGGCLAHDGQVVGTTVETYRRGRHQHQLSVTNGSDYEETYQTKSKKHVT